MPPRQQYGLPGSVLQHLCLNSIAAPQDATCISGLALGMQTPWGIRHINSSSVSKHTQIHLPLLLQKAQKYHTGHRRGLNTGFRLFKQKTGRGLIWKHTKRRSLSVKQSVAFGMPAGEPPQCHTPHLQASSVPEAVPSTGDAGNEKQRKLLGCLRWFKVNTLGRF